MPRGALYAPRHALLGIVRAHVRDRCNKPWCHPGLQVMRAQETGGKILFVDGTGAWGNPTPNNVAYGASKRAVTQLKACSCPQK